MAATEFQADENLWRAIRRLQNAQTIVERSLTDMDLDDPDNDAARARNAADALVLVESAARAVADAKAQLARLAGVKTG